MLSRVADAIYWMCRYIERAENVARFIDVNLNLMLDMPVEGQRDWQPLVTITGDHGTFLERHGTPSHENVTEFLTFDYGYPNSILSCVRAARENGRSVREVISSEMWEVINQFYLMVTDSGARERAMSNPHEFYHDVKMKSHLFTGLCEGTLSHNEGWHFTRLGRLLERADKTSRILDVKYFILLPEPEDVGTPFDSLQWSALLKSASALEMYRKKYHRITPWQVIEFLILDRAFPRAMHYCLIHAERALHGILGSAPGAQHNRIERHMGRLRAELDFADLDEILEFGLHQYLDRFQLKLNEVGDAIFDQFFALRPLTG